MNSETPKSAALPPGWFSPEDVALYTALYESLALSARTAEIGVWQGRSLCSVSSTIRRRRLEVHAVDTFDGTPGEANLVHNCNGQLRDLFIRNLSRFGLLERVRIHQGPSVRIAALLDHLEFDLVFIDADHSYRSAVADIMAWLQRLKPGGIVCGHDYHGRRVYDDAGVTRAVDKIFKGREVLTWPPSSIWCYRVPRGKHFTCTFLDNL
jgi:Methyltransferase domain